MRIGTERAMLMAISMRIGSGTRRVRRVRRKFTPSCVRDKRGLATG